MVRIVSDDDKFKFVAGTLRNFGVPLKIDPHEDDITKAKQRVLKAGDNFHVYTGLRHQMVALEDTELFEFSTQHFDSDSYRIHKGD